MRCKICGASNVVQATWRNLCDARCAVTSKRGAEWGGETGGEGDGGGGGAADERGG